MSRWYLGIDTSNYRTSAALFDAEHCCHENHGRLLDVPQGKLGLRQSEALFQHTIHLHGQIAQLTEGIGTQIRAVCVSTRPRAVEGSYMPCFLAGENVARSIAHILGVPLYICSHQQGHIVAAAYSAKQLSLLDKPVLAWHLSGGTTELLLVTPGADGLPCAQIIGGSTDISAGQLIDRAGVLLGLEFPAGPALEKLAQDSDSVKPFPVKVSDSYFSLSGMQNKVEQMFEEQHPASDIAQFTLETVLYAVKKATANAKRLYDVPVLCAGGVMSNRRIQTQMQQTFSAFFATPELSGDNAVGAAILAAQQNGECLWRVPASIPSVN
ncbi:Kae1-like domain-containing protein [Intestinibacillus sp. Marseille-P6563]|uniref:Kae1-like domain-containing protein n=1 Tax=Intestinibacillus sp. Marseille-P6563 TaxID=2364792 RepID=UPI000F04AD18|nr:DNA-binding protein [Intestinibacillus sp. Marseille-P6563]